MEKTNMRKILNQKKNIKKKKFGENTEPKRENENNTYEKNPEPKKRKKIAKRCIKNKKNICINEVKTF